MTGTETVQELNNELYGCRMCPRLVVWREAIAVQKRAAFAGEAYWGKPVPYFGDFEGDLLIVGLAPAAHGANRTGRMFTGDRSGNFLFAALWRAGLATQPVSTNLADGLKLKRVMIAATAHCAPPDNKPLPEELRNCSHYLSAILAMPNGQAFCALAASHGPTCIASLRSNRPHLAMVKFIIRKPETSSLPTTPVSKTHLPAA